MTTTTDEPRIYVADLADYNAGELRGFWVDATDDDLGEQTVAFLAERGHEEHAIHDHEGFFGLAIGEYDSLERVHDLAVLIAEHGAAFAAYAANVGVQHATAEGFDDAYAGEWKNASDYAYDTARDTAASEDIIKMFDEWPFSCIDWDHAARELILGGDIWTHEQSYDCTYIFRGA